MGAVDTWVFPPYPGERFVICCDGLSNELTPREIEAVARRHPDAEEAAAELVRRGVEAGGRDNVTAIVVAVQGQDDRLRRGRGHHPARERERLIRGEQVVDVSDPSVVVERAPDGWTHIGGPGMHLLIGLDEDDERTLTASDAADGGDIDDVIEVLTAGGMRKADHFVGRPLGAAQPASSPSVLSRPP